MIVEETKTVAQLLLELELSENHVVLVDGKRMDPDDVLEEHAMVVVLPLIAGG
ncbi:MAG: MoaD/ThiS family protein [Promethearchaeota archaeon]